ncbi:hypothetical protein H6F88_04670 [Oculatella sp. FACHB-28]|uniref:hypothetical protein n=1 Tax=Oculatella sp. FACHB-28 TaxID=2692845 RepID=UPI00168706CE|nr:hypothetical protein [Oculatella sp. FACHB-28]MBD2055324.1 hypothetical protein [Oculatella sp. FACHB-28]
MFKLKLPVALTAIVATTTLASTSGFAQTISLAEQQIALQEAVCLQDWDEAIGIVSPMIASDEATPAYRQQLVEFRSDLVSYRDTNARFSQIPNCEGVGVASETAEVEETVNQSGRTRLDWHRAAESVGNGSGRSGSVQNRPSRGNYSSGSNASSPSSDLDCSDVGSPVFVGGSDPNGLDGDGDGWGCE